MRIFIVFENNDAGEKYVFRVFQTKQSAESYKNELYNEENLAYVWYTVEEFIAHRGN